MRQALCVLLVFAVLLMCAAITLSGCGGGTSASPAGEAVVLGKVASRDGSTGNLDGVQVTALDGSVTTVTDTSDAFRLDVRSGERLYMRFEDPSVACGSRAARAAATWRSR